MSDNSGINLNRDQMVALEEELQTERLYQIFLNCSLLDKYIQINNPGSITFLDNFLPYFNREMRTHEVLFAEDEPRKYHHFSSSDQVMFVLLVPPELVVCINGQLLLKKDALILECILGVYLFNDSDQFFINTAFDANQIKYWLMARQSLKQQNEQSSSFLSHLQSA